MRIPVKTRDGGYDILIERGILQNTEKLWKNIGTAGFSLIVTDDGVPKVYSELVAKACGAFGQVATLTLPQGERYKTMETLTAILRKLIKHNATRKDRVISVGGGVVGDMTGLAAALYMRGIDWINVPTTLLSQVDSSVGGKTAIDFEGVKNAVGAFYPPKMVIIDPWTLSTLPKRQVGNGLAEALKMALTCDGKLFELFETENPFEYLEEISERAVLIKKTIVEKDERESGLRRVLNFGHTIGHGIELACDGELLHGECVAIGMVAMCSDKVRARLIPVLRKLWLPHEAVFQPAAVLSRCMHDKKAEGDSVVTVLCEEVGTFTFVLMDREALRERIARVVLE